MPPKKVSVCRFPAELAVRVRSRYPLLARQIRFAFLILLLLLINPTVRAEASSEINEGREEAKVPWKPPFVGGVNGPILGVGYNGFLQLDGASYADDASAEFVDDVIVRRARFTFHRKVSQKWVVKGSAEVSQDDFEIKDIYGLYKGLSFGSIRIGSQKEPFSLQEMTSSRFTPLMERGLIVDALSPGRNVGVTVYSQRDKVTGQIGFFGGGFDQDDIQATGAALAGRITRHFINTDQHIFHTGLSAAYRKLGTTPPQFRSRPESGVTNNYMVDTGDIENAEDVSRLGLEAAYVNGSLTLQGEYILGRVGREAGLSSLTFDGWYVHGSWFITGESRTYRVGTGTFGRVFPSAPFTFKGGGRGAWELAARVSRADLTDRDIIGGRETNISFGLNWHLREYVVVMANVIKVVDIDRPGSSFDNDDINIYQVRLQLEF